MARACDFDNSGSVNTMDYVVWRNSLGEAGVGLAADANANNVVDGGDYDMLRSHFGETADSGSLSNAAVPEPVGSAIFIAGIVATLFLSRAARS